MDVLEHLEDGLYISLGCPLVVGLGEPLAGDQLVLQLRRIAVSERVPPSRAVESPNSERPADGSGGVGQTAGKGGRALHIDRDHRAATPHVLGQDSEQRRRFPGPSGAQDQRVRRELLVCQHDSGSAGIPSQRHRA